MAEAIIPFPVARRDVPHASRRRVNTYALRNPDNDFSKALRERDGRRSSERRREHLEHFRGSPVAALVLAVVETLEPAERWKVLHRLEKKGPKHEPAVFARTALLEVL